MQLYQPINTLKQLHDDLWIVDGPAERMSVLGLGIPFTTRMVIIRLQSGDLFVWSPIALDPALRPQVDQLGPVAHLLSPNALHYAHIAAWKAAYPTAIAWASRGVRRRAASQKIDVTFDRDLADAPDPRWAEDVDQLAFLGSRVLTETVFFHRASRTLILADLIENIEPSKVDGRVLKALIRLGGASDPDGQTPLDMRATFIGRHALARASLARILAMRPERVLMAHGRWYERDGVAELERAFRWLD